MSTILAMRWQIHACNAPQPLLPCSRCGCVSAYRHSGKFRLNAQGRRLDAWLIYRCVACDTVWNRPLYERRNVRDIDPVTLHALQHNDPDLVARVAHDATQLKRVAQRIQQCDQAVVHKQLASAGRRPWSRLDIALDVPASAPLRTDRLLAGQLALTRARLQKLERDGRVCIHGCGRRRLRQPVADGLHVTVELAGLEDGQAIAMAASDGAAG